MIRPGGIEFTVMPYCPTSRDKPFAQACSAALAENAAGILPLPIGWIVLASVSLVVAASLAFVGAVYWARRISRER